MPASRKRRPCYARGYVILRAGARLIRSAHSLRNSAVLTLHARDAYAGCRMVLVARPRQFVINNVCDCFFGLGTVNENSINEESGRPVHAGSAALLLILVNVRLVLLTGQAGLELFVIELQIA